MDNNEFAYLVPAFNMIISTHEKRKKFKIGFLRGLRALGGADLL